jgi:hypothetical protein
MRHDRRVSGTIVVGDRDDALEVPMSRIFVQAVDGWNAIPLDADRVPLHTLYAVEVPAAQIERENGGASADALILRVRNEADGSSSGWAVVSGGNVRVFVNGEPLALGVALLRDRDELRVGGGAAVYFSTERLACAEPCARDDAPRCPRCAQAIEQGELSVRCPGCGVLHHQRAERECWTYLTKCALCDQASDLATGLRWTPEEL